MHGAVGGGAADSGVGMHTRRACEGKRDGSGCCVEERVWDKREREREREKNGKRQREIERGERRSKIEIDREEERKRRGERVKYG